jgi:hypothetical protein
VRVAWLPIVPGVGVVVLYRAVGHMPSLKAPAGPRWGEHRERAMSIFPSGNLNTGTFRAFSPGPHSGMPTDPDDHVAPGSIDSRARTALTLGLLSLVLSVLTGVPAIWFGRQALQHMNATDGSLRGRWAAWTGIGLGCLSVAVVVAGWVYLHEHH